MDDEISSAERALYDRMQDAMVPLIQRHVVAIAAYQDGNIRQHATGTLVQFCGFHFLVTAAHAIEAFDEAKAVYSDLRLFIDNGNANDLVPIYGKYYATQRVTDREHPRLLLGGERDDLWDVGLWELDRRTVEALTTKAFLNRSDISISADVTKGAFLLAGCPSSWSQSDREARCAKWKWFRYITHPYPEKNDLLNFDERFHIALCLGDDSEEPADLRGISGCPIWKLTELPIKSDWNANSAKLVGVQTCVYSKQPRALCGTKWAFVIPVLANMHPEIRDAFRLCLPGNE